METKRIHALANFIRLSFSLLKCKNSMLCEHWMLNVHKFNLDNEFTRKMCVRMRWKHASTHTSSQNERENTRRANGIVVGWTKHELCSNWYSLEVCLLLTVAHRLALPASFALARDTHCWISSRAQHTNKQTNKRNNIIKTETETVTASVVNVVALSSIFICIHRRFFHSTEWSAVNMNARWNFARGQHFLSLYDVHH